MVLSGLERFLNLFLEIALNSSERLRTISKETCISYKFLQSGSERFRAVSKFSTFTNRLQILPSGSERFRAISKTRF